MYPIEPQGGTFTPSVDSTENVIFSPFLALSQFLGFFIGGFNGLINKVGKAAFFKCCEWLLR